MAYYFVKIFRKFLLLLPLHFCYFIGVFIGLFLYLNPKKRSIAFKNIKSVFYFKSNYEIKKIIKNNFRNIGVGIIEALIAPRIFKYIELKGKENIHPSGGIIVAVHEGSWELYNFYIAKVLKYKMFAKEQKKKNFDKFLNELRQESRLGLCFSLKNIIRNLNDGYIVGMVIDHGAEDNALLVNFFNHLVPTPKGAVYLAKKLNKYIYPCFGYRIKKFSQVIEIGKPISVGAKDDTALLNELNRIYEKHLEKHPCEYLWFYKRFKRKKDLDILILSDTKPGHLKQSQAFVSFFKEQDYLIRDKIIEIKPQDKFRRLLLEASALLSCKKCLGCGSCLKIILGKEMARRLEATYADIVVSTGSLVAPLNPILANSLGAKSVTILRPNVMLNKFDLSIIPEHDRIQAKNTIKIKGALCYPLNLETKSAECRKFFNLTESKKIAFFLGGPLSDVKRYHNNLQVFLEKVKEFSLKNNYKILFSTSRRTSGDTDAYLEKILGSFQNTEAAVYPNRVNHEFVFDGFVSLAQIVFISNESISMISEALSFKKPCVCVMLEEHLDKHKVFLESLQNDINFLKHPYEIKDIELKISSIFDINKARVKEGIRRLL